MTNDESGDRLRAAALELYRWRFRDERTGRIRTTLKPATEEAARMKYGDRLIAPVPDARKQG